MHACSSFISFIYLHDDILHEKNYYNQFLLITQNFANPLKNKFKKSIIKVSKFKTWIKYEKLELIEYNYKKIIIHNSSSNLSSQTLFDIILSIKSISCIENHLQQI